MDAQNFLKHSGVTSQFDESSAFTKFLKQTAEQQQTRLREEDTELVANKFSKDHKSPFCIDSLLKSETRQDRYPPLSPPSNASPPPGFPAHLPQFPFPPQLLPYLLPSPQTPDYVHMEYLARQGVFLNSFPAFAGKPQF